MEVISVLWWKLKDIWGSAVEKNKELAQEEERERKEGEK